MLDPNTKKERKLRNSLMAGQSGRIKWTARGVEDCVRHLQAEFAALASRGKAKEREPYAEKLIYIRSKYGQLEGTVHYYRMAAVMLFMERHMKGLKKIELSNRMVRALLCGMTHCLRHSPSCHSSR